MSTTLYYWQVWCATDSKYEYVWLETMPTVCPVNNSHTISTNPGPTQLKTVSANNVKIIEEEKTETQGIYQFTGYCKNIPSGVGWSSSTVSWPRTVTILNGWFNPTEDNKGDYINGNISAIVGIITNVIDGNSLIIPVNSTVINNVYKGYNLHVTNFVTLDHLGEVTKIFTGNSSVLVSRSPTHVYSPYSPTYVKVTAKLLTNMYMPTVDKYEFAQKKIGGRSLPANTSVSIDYYNVDGNAKLFHYYSEILY